MINHLPPITQLTVPLFLMSISFIVGGVTGVVYLFYTEIQNFLHHIGWIDMGFDHENL